MHKKLSADLTSLAHSVLQMKNKDDILALKEISYQIFEKLAVLAYIEEYINTTPNATETKEEIIVKIKNAAEIPLKNKTETNKTKNQPLVDKNIDEVENKIVALEQNDIETITAQSFNDLEESLFENDYTKNDVRDVAGIKLRTLEEELDDTISLDVAADLFEKVPQKESLNNKLHQNITIGLNDRIAFVKHLFDGNQEDFNRIISQLNTFQTVKEATKFIKKMVKPDYNWIDKEEYEERFMNIVAHRFS